LALLASGSAVAGEAWQAEWDKVVAEAKREGQLGIVVEQIYHPVMETFRKKYPEIKFSEIGGPSTSERTQKVMAERRASLFLRDIYIGSPWNSLGEGSYQLCDPIKSALILPEVKDESKWWKGKHRYDDPKGEYIFVYEGVIKSGTIVYNKNLINPQQIKSFWDFLNPKWKEKIVAFDHKPNTVGNIADGLRLFNFHPQLGQEFIRRLYGEMDITLSRNYTQMLDWLAAGKFAFAFFTSPTETQTAIVQGLPIANFPGPHFKEGGIVKHLIGVMCLMNKAPHPNAAKLFINWLLSKEGQISFQNTFVPRSEGLMGPSLREDIPRDIIPATARRESCVNCMEYTHDMVDLTPVTKFIDEVLAKSRK